jgi:acetyltransferase-like isoleucine patch superfamily enzyme
MFRFKLRRILTTLICLIPRSRAKNSLLRLLGHSVDPTARLDSNIVIGTTRLTIGMHSHVRKFNVLRNLDFQIGNNVIIGSWNWFSAAPALQDKPNYQGSFQAQDFCAINSRNYFDCSGGILFGEYSDLAGVRSTFITHFIQTKTNIQTCAPIFIGARTMLSSNIQVAPGAKVGSKSLVALGTVLIAREYPSGYLIAGVPGEIKSRRSGEWFDRLIGPSS